MHYEKISLSFCLAQEPAELKDDLQKELQQQLKDKPKQRPKSKQSFGGLTPQERPIFLPGGRKWRNPRDAYNEDFIAEGGNRLLPFVCVIWLIVLLLFPFIFPVISSQAEIIKGTTLG
jgi:PDZ and LIM domain protein 5/6/7